MNKTILRKADSEYYDFIIETTDVINILPFLETYKDCVVIEERYIDNTLIKKITHEL